MKKYIVFFILVMLSSLLCSCLLFVPTSYTLTKDDIISRLPSDCIYWEIDSVNGEICRMYETTVSESTSIHIYYETEDLSSGGIELSVSPWGVK